MPPHLVGQAEALRSLAAVLDSLTVRRGTGSQGRPTYMAILSTSELPPPPAADNAPFAAGPAAVQATAAGFASANTRGQVEPRSGRGGAVCSANASADSRSAEALSGAAASRAALLNQAPGALPGGPPGAQAMRARAGAAVHTDTDAVGTAAPGKDMMVTGLSAGAAAAHAGSTHAPAVAAEHVVAAADAAVNAEAPAAGEGDTKALAGARLLAQQLAQGVAGLASVILMPRERWLSGCVLLGHLLDLQPCCACSPRHVACMVAK